MSEVVYVSAARLASDPEYLLAKQRFEDAVMSANLVRSLLSDLDLIAAQRQDEWTEVIEKLKGSKQKADSV